MKEILVSLKPYFYYLIGEGIKKIEVRKSCPKAKDWTNNAWFYMSKDKKSFSKIPKEYQEKYRKHFGKVGLKFTCDSVYEWNYRQLQGLNGTINTYFPIFAEDLLKTCLTHKDIENYGKGKTLYAWHISDLKIYDKPILLEELRIEKAPQSWRYI